MTDEEGVLFLMPERGQDALRRILARMHAAEVVVAIARELKRRPHVGAEAKAWERLKVALAGYDAARSQEKTS